MCCATAFLRVIWQILAMTCAIRHRIANEIIPPMLAVKLIGLIEET